MRGGGGDLCVNLRSHSDQGCLLIAECAAEGADHGDDRHAKAGMRVETESDRLAEVRVLIEKAVYFFVARKVVIDG
ncbi:MAG: hypothetical protein RI935_537 [Candidatus Parcubacteria bacterium]